MLSIGSGTSSNVCISKRPQNVWGKVDLRGTLSSDLPPLAQCLQKDIEVISVDLEDASVK